MFIIFQRVYALLLLCFFLAFFTSVVSAQERQTEQTTAGDPSTEIPETGSKAEENNSETPNDASDRIPKSESLPTVNSSDSLVDTKTAEEKTTSFKIDRRTGIRRLGDGLHRFAGRVVNDSFDGRFNNRKPFLFRPSFDNLTKRAVNDDPPEDSARVRKGFRWKTAIRQSLIFLAVQHGYALTQPKTRESLKGKFFPDYIDSVKSLRGWGDGGKFFTNYVAHPMQGSFMGHIYVQNDPQARRLEFGKSGDYWRSRLKAMAWSAAWSTQFEIGPVSQASIGNVGLSGKQTWVDIVVTPTIGTAMLVAEDAVDRFVMQSIERRTDNFYIKILLRMLLSPTRVFANMINFKPPWYRFRGAPYNAPTRGGGPAGFDPD